MDELETLHTATSRLLVESAAMSSPLAVQLLLLAGHLDVAEPGQVASLSREYRACLAEIQAQFRVKTTNPLDEISKRRQQRRRG